MDAVERNHVHSVYSQIAPHFSDTRYKPWPRIEEFLKSQPPGSLIADVGCGNGKYLGLNRLAYKLGSDICSELVAIAHHRGHEVAVCDCLCLPYRTGLFDAVICIAVIHHLSTEERRLAALRELARILRPGGKLLVYVWAMEQDGKKFDRQDVLVPWHLQPKYSSSANPNVTSPAKADRGRRGRRGKQGKKQGEEQINREDAPTPCCATNAALQVTDVTHHSVSLPGRLENVRLCVEGQAHEGSSEGGEPSPIDFKPSQSNIHALNNMPGSTELTPSDVRCGDNETSLRELGYQTFLRYYHVFQKGELLNLFTCGVSDLVVMEEVFDHDNWCVTAQKVLKI